MIIPKYWSEAKETLKKDGKQITLKRYGWSDVDETSAKEHAEQRITEAVSQVKEGKKVRKIDHKVAYNGAEGLPIREEIVDVDGDTIITRNSYGALCLNTPDVFFADVDLPYINEPSGLKALLIIGAVFVAAIALYFQFWWLCLDLLLIPIFFVLINKSHQKAKQNGKMNVLEKIRKFSKTHSELNLRVYETPHGFRVLVMNKTFSPKDEETADLLNELGSDPQYVAMCKNQNCFRARVSPKPWRIGIERIKPNPGIWPVKKEKMKEREVWINEYKKMSADFAACRFLEQLGSLDKTSESERVRYIHDKMSQSGVSGLEIA